MRGLLYISLKFADNYNRALASSFKFFSALNFFHNSRFQ